MNDEIVTEPCLVLESHQVDIEMLGMSLESVLAKMLAVGVLNDPYCDD
jgi:hypothetical protein